MCCGHGHGRHACPERPHGLSALRRGFLLQFPRRLRGNRPAVRRRASRLDNRRGAASARMERALPRPQRRGIDRARPRVGRPRDDGRHDRSTARYARHHQNVPRTRNTGCRRGVGCDLQSACLSRSGLQVIGEAEDIMAEFVAAIDGGAGHGVFEAAKFQIDVRKSPIPRFDLLKLENYLCRRAVLPRLSFHLRFCDIIELTGVCRGPRPMIRCWPSWTDSIASDGAAWSSSSTTISSATRRR